MPSIIIKKPIKLTSNICLKTKSELYYSKLTLNRVIIGDIVITGNLSDFNIGVVVYKNSLYVLIKNLCEQSTIDKIAKSNIIGKVKKIKLKNSFVDINNIFLTQSLIYNQETVKIFNKFKKNNLLSPILLKGPTIFFYYSKSYPNRIVSDSDLLINPEIKESFINQIMLSLGYKIISRSINGDFTSYSKKISGFIIIFDLYQKIFISKSTSVNKKPFFNNKIEQRMIKDFFMNCKKIFINTNPLIILEPNFFIIYLAIHLSVHRYQGYHRYYFMKQIIVSENKKINWDKIIKIIKEYNLAAIIFPVFILLYNYYQVKFPKKIHEEVIKKESKQIPIIEKIL